MLQHRVCFTSGPGKLGPLPICRICVAHPDILVTLIQFFLRFIDLLFYIIYKTIRFESFVISSEGALYVILPYDYQAATF